MAPTIVLALSVFNLRRRKNIITTATLFGQLFSGVEHPCESHTIELYPTVLPRNLRRICTTS